ncbi:uncharacterized protein [Epargyreus clarus]|uniref:uncharacterized protein n=1 Tax=Epargyreus clarus TaxID=520877 RepID=UPI003C30C300
MNQLCFVCNVRLGIALRNGINLFAEDNTLQSGKKFTEVLSEILDKPVLEETAHSKVVCKKCHKFVSEYDSIQVRMQVIKLDLLSYFQSTLPRHKLNYDTYNTETPKVQAKTPIKSAEGKPELRKLVLPASKLQPVPPDFVLKPGKWFTKANLANSKPIVTLPTSSSTLNLKVTVGTSVLTQSIKTTSAIGNKIISLTNNATPQNYVLSQMSGNANAEINVDPNVLLQSSIESPKSNSILSFNVNSLPKDFLTSAVLGKVDELVEIEVDLKKEGGQGSDVENNDEQPMEIDEDCSLAVATSGTDGNITFAKDTDQTETDKSKDFLENLLPDLSSAENTTDDVIENKYIVGKLEILNDRDIEDDGQTIMMDGENGSIIRLVSGQKLLYGDSEISLVVPEDSQEGDTNDNGDSQDSNDESQIELQVSGDEETANAIIAAAQEQGGAFIKVESGEMYRVKSVQSKKPEDTVISVDITSMVLQEEDGQFRCLLCENNDKKGAPFMGTPETMMQHLKSEHNARVYICPQCGELVRKRSEYAAHIELHAIKSKKILPTDKSKLHECTICHKKYSSRTLLAEHMNFHNGAKPYTCEVCNKSFASKYTHQSHLKTHLDRPRPFKCKQCGKSFFTQQNLTQHEKTHSGIKDFICTVCGKAFASQHNLEVHGVVHSGSRPFVCAHCRKGFARRAELRDHMRIHTGERPFACDICGATFTQNSNLHSHKRATHLDDKRYQCSLCPKKFKRRRLLDYHIKASHTGERPHRCETCGATFVYPEHFKKHTRIHSGEKPYVCEVCGKSFNSRDNRNTHRFVHSDRKPYECLVCGAGYMRKQLLYHHMNTSGHLAESIVVNQPRVMKVAKNGVQQQSVVVETVEDKTDQFTEAIYEATGELQLQTDDNKTILTVGESDDATKLFLTEDKKYVLQDGVVVDGSKINLIQDNEQPTLLTIQNMDQNLKTDSSVLEGISTEQLEQAQLMTTDSTGASLRLVEIQLPDGNNGWLVLR